MSFKVEKLGVPEDSMLRRHYLQYLQSLKNLNSGNTLNEDYLSEYITNKLEEDGAFIPQDSMLKRHFIQNLFIPLSSEADKLGVQDKLQFSGITINLPFKVTSKNISGISAGLIGSSINYADNVVLGASRGHGFAAEKANHLNDVLHGKDAKIIGGDNIKNGADRLVDGIQVQTKYCASGSKCVSECFEDSQFRYWNPDGTPMQIEVPSDMYDSAVQALENRIKKGEIKGIDDPTQAKELLRKGAFTYEQVKNIARFGTIESLTYDAINGIKLAGRAMGISAAMSYAVAIWSGEDWEVALEQACYTGLKVGGISWVSSILSAQLGRTGIEQSLRGTTDWVVQQMGAKTAAWLANGLSRGSNIYGAAAMNNVSKLLRGNIVTGVVTTLVLSSVDFGRLFSGKVGSLGSKVVTNYNKNNLLKSW